MTVDSDGRSASAIRHVYEPAACVPEGGFISYQLDMRVTAVGMKQLYKSTVISAQDGLAASGLEDGRFYRIIERRHATRSSFKFETVALAEVCTSRKYRHKLSVAAVPSVNLREELSFQV
jgi:hypothetical protein